MQQTRRPIGRRGVLVRGAIALALLAILGGLFVAHETRPWFDRAYLIVLENNGDAQIVGNTTDAPYLNHLIAGYGLATDWQAPGRPSYPNYLALVTGSTLGVTDDTPRDFGDPTLFDQLEAKGAPGTSTRRAIPAAASPAIRPTAARTSGPRGRMSAATSRR